jgi:hypothetical protein
MWIVVVSMDRRVDVVLDALNVLVVVVVVAT